MKHYGDITGESIVYMYKFPDGMIYIGTTSKSLSSRRDSGYNHNPRLKLAMKCGWRNIEKTILASGLSKDDAFAEEERYIRELDATNPCVGYNISSGGKGTYKGLRHSDAYRKAMSERCKGRSFSDETLRRMKDAHAKERHPVIRISSNGMDVFESATAAAKEMSCCTSTITRACKRKQNWYKGYQWSFGQKGGDDR